MKILHISSAHESTGAGKAVLLTHNSLLNKGYNSRILFLKSSIDVENIIQYGRGNLFYLIFRKLITKLDVLPNLFYLNRKNEIFSAGLFGINLNHNSFFLWADVIHVHWINHGFLTINYLNSIKKPIIWTLRDMWAFTGGCHYSISCNNYKTFCNKCPVLNSNNIFDLSTYLFKNKYNSFQVSKINIVAISDWLKSKALQSKILNNKEIDIIYSGIDTSKFKLLDKSKIRHKLNLTNNDKVILIGANNLNDKYKGLNFIISLLNKINHNVIILTFGKSSINKNDIPQKIYNFNYIEDVTILNELYSCSDIFLSPSIQEAFGKTFVEAQACGLACLCFDDTGPAEIIEHQKTGYVAKYLDLLDLQRGLEFLLTNNLDQDYIRHRTIELFDINISVDKYIKLYKKLHL
jgi:glycosyltransferase involved in cell wall biosynthesis